MKALLARRLVVSVVGALAVAASADVAAAQCEGGTTLAGYYLRNGSYVPGHCAATNLQTPGQLYPSGAQPAPSTNPALAASRLPGQPLATGLIPVGGTDVTGQLSGAAALSGGQFVTSAGPGAALTSVGTLGNTQGGSAYQGGLLAAGAGVTPAAGLLPGHANAFNAPGAVPGTGVVSGAESQVGRLPTAQTSTTVQPASLNAAVTRVEGVPQELANADAFAAQVRDAAAEAERLTTLANERTPTALEPAAAAAEATDPSEDALP